MPVDIDTRFEFHVDTPPGKDADFYSPTLRRYHRLLWSKRLPSGIQWQLEDASDGYLRHVGPDGELHLASDAITTPLYGRAARVIATIPESERPADLGYTVGSALVFPAVRVDGRPTINGARGLHPRIVDRFDLTLECIRRHYIGDSSPLGAALTRYEALRS